MVCYKYFGYIETNIIRNHLIKQTIMKELKTAFTEQIADEGAYLTQAAEVTDEERLFVKRRIKPPACGATLRPKRKPNTTAG